VGRWGSETRLRGAGGAPSRRRSSLLGEREPVPDDLVAELSRRRLEATRERLVQAEGISPERLRVEDPPDGAASPDAATTVEGQVEFDIAAGGE
jgi:hypothetical protein